MVVVGVWSRFGLDEPFPQASHPPRVFSTLVFLAVYYLLALFTLYFCCYGITSLWESNSKVFDEKWLKGIIGNRFGFKVIGVLLNGMFWNGVHSANHDKF